MGGITTRSSATATRSSTSTCGSTSRTRSSGSGGSTPRPATRKQAGDAETLYDFFHALSRFQPLYRGVTRLASGPRDFALSISNVPGPREHVYVLGSRATELFSIAEPADRHALRVSALSYAGTLAIGLSSDPEAVSGIGQLAGAMESAAAELALALA